MTRAFMSAGRDEALADGVAGGFAAAAVREARRILGETEPDGPQTACLGIERIAARNCAPSAWTDALADALRAFMGEE